MRFVVSLWLALLVFVAASQADERTEQANDDALTTEARALIEQLGDARFSRRERATGKLVKLGMPAMKTIEQWGLTSEVREIRYRSEIILKTLRKIDFQRRLVAFAANRDSEEDYDLPGWQRYRNLVGEDATARRLFVEMQKVDPDAMQALEQGPREASNELAAIAQEWQFGGSPLRQNPTFPRIATLLVLASDQEVPVNATANSAIYSLCHQASMQNAINTGANRTLARKLLGLWIQKGEGQSAYQGMMVAMRYDLKEGIAPAEKVVVDGGANHVRQYAIMLLAKMGNKEKHLPMLEKVLEDDNPCINMRRGKKQIIIQFRDIALAALVHLTKQNLKDYGFNNVSSNSQTVFNVHTLIFPDDNARKKALEKWKKYSASLKK